jgi:hypothetical protein
MHGCLVRPCLVRPCLVRPCLVRPCARRCCYGSRRQRRQGRAGAAGSVAGRERPYRMHRRCRQPHHAVARRSSSAATPCCENALSRGRVGDQQRYGRSWHTVDAEPERLVGRSAPGRLVGNPSRRCASHDAGQGRRRHGTCGWGRWSSPWAIPMESPSVSCGKRWIAWSIGWSRAGRPTPFSWPMRGEQQTSPSWPLAPPGIRPVMTGRLLVGKAAIPGVQARGLVCIAHHRG